MILIKFDFQECHLLLLYKLKALLHSIWGSNKKVTYLTNSHRNPWKQAFITHLQTTISSMHTRERWKQRLFLGIVLWDWITISKCASHYQHNVLHLHPGKYFCKIIFNDKGILLTRLSLSTTGNWPLTWPKLNKQWRWIFASVTSKTPSF